MKFFAAVIALVVATVVNAQVTWTDCAPGSDLNVTSMTIDPYPICAGKNLCLTIVGTLSAPITAPSDLTIVGTFFGTTIYSQYFDLCSLVSCPVAQDTTPLEFCYPVMPGVPGGIDFVITFSSNNGNGDNLFCQT
ncbi:hypothetical protein BGX20_005245, partial [Mortierella sp. AD010]